MLTVTMYMYAIVLESVIFLFALLLLLLLAAIWPKYHSGNLALRYDFIVKTLKVAQTVARCSLCFLAQKKIIYQPMLKAITDSQFI